MSELAEEPFLANSVVPIDDTHLFHQDPRKRRDALLQFVGNSNSVDFCMYPNIVEALNDDYERCRSLAIQIICLMRAKYADCLVFQKGSDEQIRLEDDAFTKICRMMTDSDVQVRIEAAKSISQFRSAGIHYLLATLDKRMDGAFVFGLEDEKKDVRMAALESLCQISKIQPVFAQKSLDFIVDMFNDEIDDIRLKAIHCLHDIDNVALRDDQVEIILSVLASPSMDIREALHRMLAKVNLSSAYSLRRCIESILNNLSKYPQDKLSIFNSFKFLGQNHPKQVYLLVNELLAIHPYLKLPEHSLIDDNYIATLILIYNASSKVPSILEALENHTLQHQTYIRKTFPDFMPQTEKTKSQASSALFFIGILERLGKMLKSDNSQRSKIALMEKSLQDLTKFGSIEPEFRASTKFYLIVLESILTMSRVLNTRDWMESGSSLELIRRVVDQTFGLLRRFHKLNLVQRCCIQQIKIQALAIELIIFINKSNASALDICNDFVEEMKIMDSFINDEPFLDSIALCGLSSSIMNEISYMDQPKPGQVARKLEPLFNISLDQIYETLIVLIESQNNLHLMRISSATINSIPSDKDVHKFTAGLVLALTLDAIVENIINLNDVRIKVSYPDKQAHIIVPIASHFRLISKDEHSETCSYRLYTTLNLCHSYWTESSYVEISIILDHRENPSTSIHLDHIERSEIIDISEPINLLIHPQNTRW